MTTLTQTALLVLLFLITAELFVLVAIALRLGMILETYLGLRGDRRNT